MRISDWSSDVCSSDLQPQGAQKSITRVDRAAKGQDAPATPFLDPIDQPVTLAAFRGKPLIVNLWATWCAPCLTEMPSLDRLAGQLDGKVQLIVVSADIEGRRAVTPYFEKMAFKHLRPYLDKENVLPLGVKAAGLPVTLVYDAEGKEVLRVNGPLRSEEHTSELQSLMRISYAVFCLKKKNEQNASTAHT